MITIDDIANTQKKIRDKYSGIVEERLLEVYIAEHSTGFMEVYQDDAYIQNLCMVEYRATKWRFVDLKIQEELDRY